MHDTEIHRYAQGMPANQIKKMMALRKNWNINIKNKNLSFLTFLDLENPVFNSLSLSEQPNASFLQPTFSFETCMRLS